jgi:hypothetical protein
MKWQSASSAGRVAQPAWACGARIDEIVNTSTARPASASVKMVANQNGAMSGLPSTK